MSERARFVLVLEPLVGVNGILALRRLLKFALRACGLKCIRITREKERFKLR